MSFSDQKEVAPMKAASQIPVIESSIPSILDKVKPAPAPATQRGQWARAGLAETKSNAINKLKTRMKFILKQQRR